MRHDDIRSALRAVLRRPGLHLLMVGTLALGIGAATTVFSVVHRVLLEPLPFPDSHRLVAIWEATPEGDRFSMSYPTYRDVATLDVFEGVGALSDITDGVVLSGAGEPVRVQAAAVTASLFGLLRPVMTAGRPIADAADAPGADASDVVISHRLWTGRFAARADIAGTPIVLDGRSFTIVGVVAPDMGYPATTDVWMPLVGSTPMASLPDRDDKWLSVVGRLAPTQTVAQATSQLQALGRRIGDSAPAANGGWSIETASLQASMVTGPPRLVLWTLTGAVGCLLLLACANVAGLLLIDAIRRDGEFRLRAALGATGWRLARQLFVESAVLAALGAAGGIGIALWAVAALRTHGDRFMPGLDTVAVGTTPLLMAVALASLSCLLIGTAPGVRAATLHLRAGLDSAGQGTRPSRARLRRGLIVLEVALALVLVAGAGLMATSVSRLAAVDVGLAVDHVLAVPLDLGRPAGRETPEEFLRAFESRLSALPEVAAVGASTTNPWRQFGFSNSVTPEERAATAPPAGLLQAQWRAVTPGFFQAVGLPVLRGTTFAPTVGGEAPRVVVLSRALADRLWPDQDPVGKRILWGGTTGRPRTVIGVVGDMRDVRLDEPAPPLLYVPHVQTPVPAVTVMVKARGSGAALMPAVGALLRELAPDMPTPGMTLLASNQAEATARPRLVASALLGMGAIGVLLASSGIYALLAAAVVQRRREMSIRLAVGSTPVQVRRLVLVEGLRLTLWGLVLGLLTVLSIGDAVAGALFEVAPSDPLLLALAAGVLVVSALLASYLPARAASRIDPVQALRSE